MAETMHKKYASLGIRKRLFLVYSASFLVVLVLMSAFTYTLFRANIRKRINNELNNTTLMIKKYVETSADVSVRNYLRAVAEKNLDIVRYHYNEFKAGNLTEGQAKILAGKIMLSQIIGETGYVYVCDSNGKPVIHPEPSFIGVDFSHMDFVSKMIKLKDGYYEYKWQNKTDRHLRAKAQYVQYFKPWDWIVAATSYRKEFAHLIAIDDFRDQILSLRLGPSGYSLIMDSNGTIVVHPITSGSFYDVTDEQFIKYIDKICREKTGHFLYDWKNPGEEITRKKIIYFKYIEQYDWIVASTAYLSEIYEPLKKLRLVSGVTFFMAMLLFVFVTYRASATITNPVELLTQRIKKSAREHFDSDNFFRVSVVDKDEISILSDCFHQFVSQLEKEAEIRKSAEHELRILRNYLKDVIDSMPSIIIGLDYDGKISLCNAQAESIAGPLDFSVPMGFGDYLPELAAEGKKVYNAVRSGHVHKEERVAYTLNGEKRFCDITVYPLTEDETGAVLRIDDVTERIRVEEMMMQSEKMLSVGGLAAGMAHEINNPLAGILQNLQVMRNRVSGHVRKNREIADTLNINLDQLKKYMEIRGIYAMMDSVVTSGRRVARIVDNMLSFSRSGDTDFQPCSVEKMLEETIDIASNDYSLEHSYDFKNIKIRRDYKCSGVLVNCERSNIQQVFFNILKNSAESMVDAGGENPTIDITVDQQYDSVAIVIEDNGPGISVEHQRRIFEPFYTTKPVGSGTGLGLYISYFIVKERHGGDLKVSTGQHYGGARFLINLPVFSKKRANRV